MLNESSTPKWLLALQPSKFQAIQALRRVMVGRIRIAICLVALGALIVPAVASARQHHWQDFKSASKQCKALRAEMGNRAFKQAFGAGKHKRRALRRCIARGGVLPVTEQSETQPAQCPPGTSPEAPQPVHAFATSPTVCVVTPPADTPATPAEPAADDEDGDDQAGDDEAGDRDHADADDHGDDGRHESDRGEHGSDHDRD
jgi:hypothetical protein